MPAARDLIPLVEALEAAWRAAEAAGLATKTTEDYRQKLGLFDRFLRVELGREPLLAEFTHARALDYMLARRHQQPPLSRDTLASDARALRAASKWLSLSRQTRAHRLDTLPIPDGTRDDGRILHGGEIEALFDAARGYSAAACRASAALGVLLDGGPRAGEYARLRAERYRPISGAIQVHEPGKGGPVRRIALGSAARRLVREHLAGARTGPLIGDAYGRGTAMTGDGLRSLLVRLSEKAGVERASPQDFRRTSSTLYLASGLDQHLHSLLFGWVDVDRSARARYIVLDDDQFAALVTAHSPLDRLGILDRRRRAA